MTCQWISAEQDPQKGPVHYCGQTPLWPGRSYCEEHVWRVYQKGTGLGVSRKNRRIERQFQQLRSQQDPAAIHVKGE
jgi:hypothetical protein